MPVTASLSRESTVLQFCGRHELAAGGGFGGSVRSLACLFPSVVTCQVPPCGSGPGRLGGPRGPPCGGDRDPTACPSWPPQGPFAASVFSVPVVRRVPRARST